MGSFNTYIENFRGQQIAAVALPPGASQVTATGWALQGRVFAAHLQPAVGYSVFFVDSMKNYVSACGVANSDVTGYFVINYPGNAPAGQAVPDWLFLSVTNPAGKQVYLSPVAFQPVLGRATYQNIMLAG